ncbi:ribokinase [Vibrio sp. SM6]|uniref:Ribokinase n=1 Tax=Vibrio agarilyticus TaxID=2726741 RepID=A0A7X8YHL9_9VIBR|nr:PfkB family carbohydrate kinase [Vibrio agarilyticus]NLS14228.1 ribokinase [Vibrio agarilyticus]
MQFDVLVSGLNVVDLLVIVPNSVSKGRKHEIDNIIIQGGAPAGNGACGMSALGLKTSFLGFIGDNVQSAIARAEFSRFNVDTSLLIKDPKIVPATALVEVDSSSGERTVFYSTKGYRPLGPNDIKPEWLDRTKLLYVDGYDLEGNIELLRIAQQKGVPSILDVEAGDPSKLLKMIQLGNHVILPLEAAQTLTTRKNPIDCLKKLATETHAQLIITDGANGSWALAGDEIITQPCYEVAVVDTTGCGDAYHAAYAYALLKNYSLPKRMEFASAFAAIVATHFGGRSYFPNEEEVKIFIQNHQ